VVATHLELLAEHESAWERHLRSFSLSTPFLDSTLCGAVATLGALGHLTHLELATSGTKFTGECLRTIVEECTGLVSLRLRDIEGGSKLSSTPLCRLFADARSSVDWTRTLGSGSTGRKAFDGLRLTSQRAGHTIRAPPRIPFVPGVVAEHAAGGYCSTSARCTTSPFHSCPISRYAGSLTLSWSCRSHRHKWRSRRSNLLTTPLCSRISSSIRFWRMARAWRSCVWTVGTWRHASSRDCSRRCHDCDV
jgi:hypothetical protein